MGVSGIDCGQEYSGHVLFIHQTRLSDKVSRLFIMNLCLCADITGVFPISFGHCGSSGHQVPKETMGR